MCFLKYLNLKLDQFLLINENLLRHFYNFKLRIIIVL